MSFLHSVQNISTSRSDISNSSAFSTPAPAEKPSLETSLPSQFESLALKVPQKYGPPDTPGSSPSSSPALSPASPFSFAPAVSMAAMDLQVPSSAFSVIHLDSFFR